MPSTLSNTAIIATVAAVATASYVFTVLRRRIRIPGKWNNVGKVGNLNIYPLKSGRRYEVEDAECTSYGLMTEVRGFNLRDRCFVIYCSKTYKHRSIIQYPSMVLINIDVKDRNNIILSHPSADTHNLTLPTLVDGQRTQITLDNAEVVDCWDCGHGIAEWISEALLGKSSGLRLGYHDGNFKRNLTQAHKIHFQNYPYFENKFAGMYSNLTSYLLITQSSLNALNKHLTSPVTEHNFRANILVDGEMTAFAEEDWNWIKIGDAVFRNVRLCARCMITTIGPETGVRDVKREPMKTLQRINPLKSAKHLAAYGRKGVMGINLGLIVPGEIKIGDDVYIS